MVHPGGRVRKNEALPDALARSGGTNSACPRISWPGPVCWAPGITSTRTAVYSDVVSTHYVNLPHLVRLDHSPDPDTLPTDQHRQWRWQNAAEAAVADDVHPCAGVRADRRRPAARLIAARAIRLPGPGERNLAGMRSLLPSLPGLDVPGLIRRVDTVRHHGVPGGCILEANLQSVPPETAGFDPVRLVTGAGRPLLLRDAVAAIHRAAEDDRVAGLIARVQLSAAPPAAVQELREAISAFAAAKPSLAWAETFPARCPTTWPRPSAKCGCSPPAPWG